jgi:putative flippase GtrA
MIELSILISAVISNFITNKLKSVKPVELTEEELVSRNNTIRTINAFVGLAVMVVTYTLTGGDLNPEQLATYVEILVGGLVTFTTSQGLFFLKK